MSDSSRVHVLYDGACAFCRKSIALLRKLDWLGRLDYIDVPAYLRVIIPVSAVQPYARRAPRTPIGPRSSCAMRCSLGICRRSLYSIPAICRAAAESRSPAEAGQVIQVPGGKLGRIVVVTLLERKAGGPVGAGLFGLLGLADIMSRDTDDFPPHQLSRCLQRHVILPKVDAVGIAA